MDGARDEENQVNDPLLNQPAHWLQQLWHDWWGNFNWNWAWVSEQLLNLLAMSASCTSLVMIHSLIKQKGEDDKASGSVWVLKFLFVSVILFSLFMLVSQIYVSWIRAVTRRFEQWGWADRFPRWFICNASMSLSICFVKLDPVIHLVLAGSIALTVVAMLSRAHRRHDPSGLTEGLSTCFLICFITFMEVILVEDKKQVPSQCMECGAGDTKRVPHAITSILTTLLCVLCSVLPAPAPDDVPPQQPPQTPPPPPPWSGQIENLQAQISSFKQEFDKFKSTVPGGSRAQGLEDQLKSVSHQSQSLKDENLKLLQLNSSMELQISSLNKASGEMKTEEEKLCNQLRNLELEVDFLRSQKDGLEEELKTMSGESKNLRAENSEMLKLQSSMKQEISSLKKASGEMKSKEEKVCNQLRNLEKSLEEVEENGKGPQASKEKEARSENENSSMTELIATLQKKQQHLLATVSKLREEKGQFELNYQLSNRRKAEAEQALEEKEASTENAEQEFHRERNPLKKQVGSLENDISSAKSDLRETKDCLQKAVTVCNELELNVQSSTVDDVSNEHIISKYTEEIQDAKIAGIGKLQERLQKNITAVIEERDEKNEKEVSLREEVEKLEAVKKEERPEKEKLSRKVEDLEENQKEMKAREGAGEELARDETDAAIG